jgi:aromatic ring hydroxylase
MWINLILFLQYGIPIGVVLWLVWRFVAVPAVRTAQVRMAEEERSHKIQEEIRRRMAEQSKASAPSEDLTEEEIKQAVDEYLEDNTSTQAKP